MRDDLARLLAWSGISTEPLEGAHLLVDALDAFPGQATDRATWEHATSAIARGIPRLLEDFASISIFVSRPLTLPVEGPVRIIRRPSEYPPPDAGRLRQWASDSNAVVFPLAAIVAVGEATRGSAILDRWVTVAGRVREPGTFRVPLGTTVSNLIRLAGGRTDGQDVPLRSQPLRVAPWASSVALSDASFVVLPHDHLLVQNDRRSWDEVVARLGAGCSRCAICDDVCPAGPRGFRVRALVDAFRWSEPNSGPPLPVNLTDCMGCRLCETVCPSQLAVGRLAFEVAQRLPAAKNHVCEVRTIPRDAFGRRLGITGDADRFVDAREAVRRVRLPLRQGSGRARTLVARGDHVWRGDPIASDATTGRRIVAPITGSVSRVEDAITIGRTR